MMLARFLLFVRHGILGLYRGRRQVRGSGQCVYWGNMFLLILSYVCK